MVSVFAWMDTSLFCNEMDLSIHIELVAFCMYSLSTTQQVYTILLGCVPGGPTGMKGTKNNAHAYAEPYKECIVIKDPSPRNGDASDRITIVYSVGEVAVTSFRRPSHVGVDEAFTVKVECVKGGGDRILVCDKSQECEFCVGSEQKAYNKLLSKVRSEEVTAGTKTYMSASFDKKGYCYLFLNQNENEDLVGCCLSKIVRY